MHHATPHTPPMRDPQGPVAPAAGDNQRWRLSVSCPRADKVMLVRDDTDGLSKWEPMTRLDDSGVWELALSSDAFGRGLRYYTVERGAVVNCGTAGLSATRIVG